MAGQGLLLDVSEIYHEIVCRQFVPCCTDFHHVGDKTGTVVPSCFVMFDHIWGQYGDSGDSKNAKNQQKSPTKLVGL